MEEKLIKLSNVAKCIPLSDYKILKISNDIRYIYLQLLNNLAVLYYISRHNEFTEGPIWEGDNINSGIFSDDDDKFFVISKENSCKIYRLHETSITILQEITKNELGLVLAEFNIELTNESDVKLKKFNNSTIVMMLYNAWIVTLKWNGEVLAAGNKIGVASCITVDVGHDTIYALTAGGNVSAYNLCNGVQKGVVHLYALVPPSQAKDVLGFKHLSVNVDGSLLAVSDRANQVFVVCLKSAFTDTTPDHQRWDCGTSVRSFSSDISQTTTVSHCQLKILPDTVSLSPSIAQVPVPQDRSCKATWSSYLESLNKTGFKDSDDQSFSMDRLPDPPSGLTVRSLHLVNKELSVWFSEPDALAGGVFRLHDLASNSYVEQQVPSDTLVVPGGLAGLKDAFLSARGLHMFLGTMPHEILVCKMLHCMQRESLSRLLHGEAWSNLMVPLPAVLAALKQQQLDVVQLTLNIYVHGVKSTFKNVSEFQESTSLIKLATDLDQLLVVIGQTCIEYSKKKTLRNQLITTTLEQANRLLEFLGNNKNSFAEDLIRKIMNHVVVLRKYLSGPSEAKELNNDNVLCPKLLRQEWERWSDLSDKDVMKDAILTDCVPLCQVFFIQEKSWPKEIFHDRYLQCINEWVSSLLQDSDVEKAEMILWKAGEDPRNNFLEMCLECEDPTLRDRLSKHLLELGVFPAAELDALNFMKQIEDILSIVDFSKLRSRKEGYDNMPVKEERIKLSTVVKQSEEWRQLVLISLFFNVPGAGHLELLLQPEFVWLYLLENNSEDLLCTWITCAFSDYPLETIPACVRKWNEKMRNIPLASSAHSYNYITPEHLIKVFTRWHVTQNMVNAIASANAMPSVKELVLNHLSRYGLFSFSEKTDARVILQRMILTGNVRNLEKTFNQKSANVSYADFKLLFTKYLIKNNLPEIAFPCLEDFEYSEEQLEILCDPEENKEGWFPLWLAFRDIKNNLNDHRSLYQAVLKNAQYLSKGDLKGYLEKHPLVVLALLIYEGRSLAEVFSSGEGAKHLDSCVLSATLRHFPLLEKAVTSVTNPTEEKPDITLYQLLEGNTPFDVSKLFGWQESHRIEGEEFPSFTSPKLVEKYGMEYKMTYLIYLKLARPCFAVCRFVVDQYQKYATLSQKRIKDAVNMARDLALHYFDDTEISASCIAFTEILGEDSSKLKIDLSTVRKVYDYIQQEEDIDLSPFQTFGEMVNQLMFQSSESAVKFLYFLEKALAKEKAHKNTFGREMVEEIAHWGLAVKFALSYELKLPEMFLRMLTKENNLFVLMVFTEIYRYPLQQVKELSASFSSTFLQEHLFHILQVEVNSEKENEPQLIPRDERKSLYSKPLTKKTKTKQDESLSVGRPKKTSKRRRDSEQIDEQKGSGDKMLGLAVSSSSGSSADDTFGVSLISYDIWKEDEKNDMFLVILKCHNAPYPLQAMLQATFSLRNPVLAVLATCYDLTKVIPCFCAWLIVSLPLSSTEKLLKELGKGGNDLVWTGDDVLRILVEAVSCQFIRTLQHGIWIFFPDHPLSDFMDMLYEGIIMKDFEECLLRMKTFNTSYLKMKTNGKNLSSEFINDYQWVGHVAVQLCKTALSSALTSLQYSLEFLAAIQECSFMEHLPGPIPDFKRIEGIVKSLALTGVFPNLEFLMASPESTTFRNEVNRCMHNLLQSKQFSCALELAAATDLSRDPVLMAQWSDKFEQSTKKTLGRDYLGFWKKCDDAFHAENVHPHSASKFFQEHAEKLEDPEEEFRVLQLAVAWLQEALNDGTDNLTDVWEVELASVERNMWNCWLKAPSEISLMKGDMEPEILRATKSNILEESGISRLKATKETYIPEFERKIHNLVNSLLDMGNIVSACRVEAMYGIKHQDLSVVLLCLGLAEGTVSPYELTAEQRLLFADLSSIRSLNQKRRALVSTISTLSQSPGTTSLLDEYVEIPARDKQDTLTSLEKLTARLKHGVLIGNRLVMCYRVAMNLDLNYLDVLLMQEPLSLLKTALADDCRNKFIVATDIITAAQINIREVAEFLAGEILEAVTKSKLKGEILGTKMWGVELESNFHLVLDICKDQDALGGKILGLAAKTTSSKEHEFHDAHVIAVELIIYAHHCFVAALSVEGIGSVLQMSQAVSKRLQKKEEWTLMVRLLTGVERYVEMHYIFKILYNQEHFEYLLAKGLDKAKGLKIAIIDFLKKYHPEDRKLYEMVTLRFSMFEEVAVLWESDGLKLEDKLIDMCLKDPQTNNRCLPNTEEVQEHMVKMMECFKQAAEFFLKAELLNRAVKLVNKSRLVALQRYFMSTVALGQNAPLLLRLNSEELTSLVNHLLTFPQAFIVVQAYEYPVHWAAALYEHCVVNGDESYFTSFTASLHLDSTVVEEIVRRYAVSKDITTDSERIMRKFIHLVDSIELKYRLASQLGFRDMIESLLNGPEDDVAYLKDTIWKYGFRS